MFYENESICHPITCGCVLARDESDHSTESKHWENSTFITMCEGHKDAGSTAEEVHTHAMSYSVALDTLVKALPPTSFVLTKKQVSFDGGKSWVDSVDPMEKDFLAPPFAILSPKTGQIVIDHQDMDKQIAQTIKSALEEHPYADLIMADEATTAAVKVAVSNFVTTATPEELTKPIVFDVTKDGSIEFKQAVVA